MNEKQKKLIIAIITALISIAVSVAAAALDVPVNELLPPSGTSVGTTFSEHCKTDFAYLSNKRISAVLSECASPGRSAESNGV